VLRTSWLPHSTGAQDCQGRCKRGEAGALTALWTCANQAQFRDTKAYSLTQAFSAFTAFWASTHTTEEPFLNDDTLDIEKAASFLCADCLNEILPQRIDLCSGVGVISLKIKEIKMIEEDFTGFSVRNFVID